MNKTILLVEDNVSDVDLTKRALSKCNIANRLVVVADGEEAVDYLFGIGGHAGRDTADQPALTLLDLNLPKVSGLEVLRRVREDSRTRRLPIVILTSSREDSDLIDGYDLGANSYVVKPVDFERFQKALDHLGLYWLVVNEPPPAVQRVELK